MGLVEDTARAWKIKPEKVRGLYEWTGRTIAPQNRGIVLTKLLRQYSPYGKPLKKPKQTKLL